MLNIISVGWIWLIVILLVILLSFIAVIVKRNQRIRQINKFIREKSQGEKEKYINQLIAPSGFQYNAKKDIFYTMEHTWQKKYGYCRLYDEAAAPFGMIIDCEPIFFEYDGQKWMLEFWKGQYGMTAGAEVGLYLATDERGVFFKGVNTPDYIGMKMEVFYRGRPLFERSEDHWWLTGFRLGLCAAPKELKTVLQLTFQNRIMCVNFVDALRRAGYSSKEYLIKGDSVKILFHSPHTRQPSTRGPWADRLGLWRSRMCCRLYNRYTKQYHTTADKLIALQSKAPWLFDMALQLGRSSKLYEKNRQYVD